jgi:hypothetical protein
MWQKWLAGVVAAMAEAVIWRKPIDYRLFWRNANQK